MKYIKNTTEFFIEDPTVISLGKCLLGTSCVPVLYFAIEINLEEKKTVSVIPFLKGNPNLF